MLSDENAKQTLIQLGLTILEARIYLSLCKYESLTTKTLSGLTKTAQPDTYRVLAKLQKKGLIEKKITKPAKFKAVPMDLGIDSLLKRKSLAHDNLKAKAKLLLREYKERTIPQPFELEAAHFALIPQRETVVKRIREAIDNAEKSVDIFLSWKRFSLGITSTFAESSQKAWGRGVKFRIVVESPREAADVELAWHFCQKSPFCNVRFLPRPPRTVLGIYDKKHFFVIVHPKEGLFDSPALWSNNKSLLSVIEDYFEILWVTAMEEPKPSKSV